MRKIVLIYFMCMTSVVQVNAQFEPQFTQYMFNEMFINPAYAGVRENISATAFYRNQWVGIEGAPKTQTFSIHGPVYKNKVGIGLSVMNEEIGVMHQFAALSNYAYRINTGAGNLAFGLQLGVVNFQENLADLITVDPNDQQFLENTPTKTAFNAGYGMYFNNKKFFAGISIPRMVYNKINVAAGNKVENTVDIRNWHYFLTSGYVWTLSEDLKLKTSTMIKAVDGAPLSMDFNAMFLIKEMLWIGGGYRSEDAVAAMVQFQFNDQLRAGYSFDYTLSRLQNYNSGTHEIMMGYDFSFNKKKVITPRYF
ncbi:MAG TPA: type IX secretion system membrane protein PorP/SprF [Bacteroidia bacterium]|nr:type IX secretion system membrane protein PorP/SprF [Bacteroidia bacterium]HNT80870.1 type IX secretion system membrane protein PorP/SprF [Bacteroidia bacterium]